jgi:hypothetical protein
VWRIVDGVGQLDCDRCVRSLQLNPECRLVGSGFAHAVMTRLQSYVTQDKEILARIQAALSKELATLARQGRIPVLQRDLYPEIYDVIETRCRSAWMSRDGVGAGHDWGGDREYQVFLKNRLCNELRRNTKHRVRIDIGATGQTHVATYSDCTIYVEMMMRGHREILET